MPDRQRTFDFDAPERAAREEAARAEDHRTYDDKLYRHFAPPVDCELARLLRRIRREPRVPIEIHIAAERESLDRALRKQIRGGSENAAQSTS